MNIIARKFVGKIVGNIPLGIYKYLYKHEPIGLCYHIISDEPIPHIDNLYLFKSAAAFERDLCYLKAYYNFISYNQLVDYIHKDRSLPENSVILTFDDGFSQCFSEIRPILLRYDVPCIFFITTDFIDNNDMFYRNKISLCISEINKLNLKILEIYEQIKIRFGLDCKDTHDLCLWLKSLKGTDEELINTICDLLEIDIKKYLNCYKPYLTSSEIKVLAKDGFTIGAHGRNHIKLQLLNKKEIYEEIVESCKKIKGLTDQNHVPFAFPYYAKNIDRQLLADIPLQNSFVGLFFDAERFKQDIEILIDRLWADEMNIEQAFADYYRRSFYNMLVSILKK